MVEKLSGRAMAVNNLARFEAWVVERDAANDWVDYIRGDKLNRSEIASECGFALSVVRQNPAVKAALTALEERLQDSGAFNLSVAAPNSFNEPKDEKSDQAVQSRIMAAKGKAEQRVKALEEQNATLRAQVRDLREQLAQFTHLDEHLSRTGRLLQP